MGWRVAYTRSRPVSRVDSSRSLVSSSYSRKERSRLCNESVRDVEFPPCLMFALCAGQNDKLYRGMCYFEGGPSFENNVEIDIPRTAL